MIRRWHYRDGPQPIEGPFVSSARILDIPHTIIGAINNLRPNCVGVAVVLNGQTDVAAIERAARRRRLRVLWIAKRGGRTL